MFLRLWRTFSNIVRFYARTAVLVTAVWFVFTYIAGMHHWTEVSNGLLFVWLVMPLMVVYVFPVIGLIVAIASADPGSRTYAEGFTGTVFVPWVIGLLYAIALRLGDWQGHEHALVIMLASFAAAAGLQASWFGGARWTKFTTKLLLAIALTCALFATSKKQVAEVGRAIGTNWVPSADSIHEAGKDVRDYAEEVREGATIATAKRQKRMAQDVVGQTVELKEATDVSTWAVAAATTIPNGYVPAPPPSVKRLHPNWLPNGLMPDRFRDTDGADYAPTMVKVSDSVISVTYYSPKQKESFSFTWVREEFVAHLKYEDGRTNIFPIAWDPQVGEIKGGKSNGYRFFIEVTP